MATRNVLIRIFLFFVLDVVALNSALGFAGYVFLYINPGESINSFYFLLINSTWIISAWANKLYKVSNVQAMGRIWSKTLLTLSCQVVFVGLACNWLNIQLNQRLLIYGLLAEFAALIFVRLIIYITEINFQHLHSFKRTIAVIGNNEASRKVAKYFKKNGIAYKFIGHYQNPDRFDGPIAEDLRYQIQFAIENNLDELYLSMPAGSNAYLESVINLADQYCVKIRYITTLIELEKNGVSDHYLSAFCDGVPILTTRPEPLNTVNNRIRKRLFDIVFSSLVIVFILSWLMPLIGLLIKLESPGPVIFKQLRSGRNNKPFWCYKFRSMRLNNDSNHVQATKNDRRVTKIGAILRKTSIDELPQFFNVLFGNMSVVGPRPHMVSHTDSYRLIIEQYMMRLYSKPGITGWAQVNGYRGETKDREQMLRRVDHDIWYLENWSIVKDINITYKTVLNAVNGEANAY